MLFIVPARIYPGSDFYLTETVHSFSFVLNLFSSPHFSGARVRCGLFTHETEELEQLDQRHQTETHEQADQTAHRACNTQTESYRQNLRQNPKINI